MFKSENEKVFRLLCDAAQESEFKHKHASCICHKGRVLSIGTNQRKTHPLQAKYSDKDARVWLHSEIDAIVQVINRHGAEILKDCELFNLRLTRGGNIGNSKPCEGCSRAIEAFEIGRVYWT